MSYKIYTTKGDDFSTGTYRGPRVSKAHERIEAIGTVDELNCWLGAVSSKARSLNQGDLSDLCGWLQNILMLLSVDLATVAKEGWEDSVARVSYLMVEEVEKRIDHIEANLPPLKNLILPGGTEISSQLHISRSVCRRAERRIAALAKTAILPPAMGPLINRISDLLFVLARQQNHLEAGTSSEILWIP